MESTNAYEENHKEGNHSRYEESGEKRSGYQKEEREQAAVRFEENRESGSP